MCGPWFKKLILTRPNWLSRFISVDHWVGIVEQPWPSTPHLFELLGLFDLLGLVRFKDLKNLRLTQKRISFFFIGRMSYFDMWIFSRQLTGAERSIYWLEIEHPQISVFKMGPIIMEGLGSLCLSLSKLWFKKQIQWKETFSSTAKIQPQQLTGFLKYNSSETKSYVTATQGLGVRRMKQIPICMWRKALDIQQHRSFYFFPLRMRLHHTLSLSPSKFYKWVKCRFMCVFSSGSEVSCFRNANASSLGSGLKYLIQLRSNLVLGLRDLCLLELKLKTRPRSRLKNSTSWLRSHLILMKDRVKYKDN